MYGFYYDVPGNQTFYRRINELLGQPPDGLVVHLAVEQEGALRHFNVWSNKEQWEAYRDGDIRPAVNKVLGEAGIPEPPAPDEVPMSIVGLFSRGASI